MKFYPTINFVELKDCPNLHENEYGEKVCRYTDCPCNCHSRKDCRFSTYFDGVSSEFD